LNRNKIPLSRKIFRFEREKLPALPGQLPIIKVQSPHRLPFLLDFTFVYQYVVSLPCVVALIVTDQPVLTRALRTVRADGTVTISEADWSALAKRWNRWFQIVNLVAQGLGLAIGFVVAYFLLTALVPASQGHWVADRDHLQPAGYAVIYCTVLFWAAFTIYVIRNCVIALLLWDIVAHAHLHILPLHPDKAGGLQPVGYLGLRNQYALTLLGLNAVIAIVMDYYFVDFTNGVLGMIASTIIAYVVLKSDEFSCVFLRFLPFGDGRQPTAQ
jgi:hypothetical protein